MLINAPAQWRQSRSPAAHLPSSPAETLSGTALHHMHSFTWHPYLPPVAHMPKAQTQMAEESTMTYSWGLRKQDEQQISSCRGAKTDPKEHIDPAQDLQAQALR